MGFYRFFSNARVTCNKLIELAKEHCGFHSQNISHILLLQDTTELNLESNRSRINDKNGLGSVGNDKDLGFFCYPTLAINTLNYSIIGISDVHLWHRNAN